MSPNRQTKNKRKKEQKKASEKRKKEALKVERERAEREAQVKERHRQVVLAEEKRLREMMTELGFTGKTFYDSNGYLTGPGYLDMTDEDVANAKTLDVALNLSPAYVETIPSGVGYLPYGDKLFVTAKHTGTGRVVILGQKDKKDFDVSGNDRVITLPFD